MQGSWLQKRDVIMFDSFIMLICTQLIRFRFIIMIIHVWEDYINFSWFLIYMILWFSFIYCSFQCFSLKKIDLYIMTNSLTLHSFEKLIMLHPRGFTLGTRGHIHERILSKSLLRYNLGDNLYSRGRPIVRHVSTFLLN